MDRIRIGYLPMYIKLYDDSNPRYREPMVRHMHTLISMLQSEGLEVITAEVCRVREEFDAAAQLFNERGVAAVVTQHLAYSPSLESIDALLSIEAPLIVLDTTPDYDLLSFAATRNGIAANHGIHGVQDMCNLLRQRGRPYFICAGHALHSDVIAQTAGLCRAAAVRQAFRRARVGLVGGAFDGMGDFSVTPERLRRDIGAAVVSLDESETLRRVQAVTPAEVDAEIDWDRQHFTVEIEDTEAYRASVLSGLAIRRWAQEAELTACTVNFLNLDRYGLPKMPFAECSKMMMRGLGYAGEGDVLTAGLVGALRSVYPCTTFTEMFCPDWKHGLILLNHMGEFNLSLAAWKPVLKDAPFNYNACGTTAAAYGCLRGGEAVFVNLAPMGDRFTLILSPVTLQDVGLEFGAYRYSVQGWLRPPLPLPEFLTAFSLAGGTHHSALVYHASAAELESFGRMMGFDTCLIA